MFLKPLEIHNFKLILSQSLNITIIRFRGDHIHVVLNMHLSPRDSLWHPIYW